MTNYSCYKCGQSFNQKGHLDAHLNKKKTCQKCNCNFKTNYAYINDKPIHISDYIKTKLTCNIKCDKGHELIFANGKIIKPYFRHKHSKDVDNNPMSDFHIEWQRHFPVTEVYYPKIKGQIKSRRADIDINEHDMIIEIQHSKIDDSNVICRNSDYKLHNKELIWIVDGNTADVRLEELSDGQFLIIFTQDWKYKSFLHTYEFILLDIDNKIFKIPVNKVVTKMIKVKEYVLRENIVNTLLIEPKNIWNLWNDDNSCECNLIIWQKGAGNGKTYGLWKSVIENKDKNTFILLSTKHSEKDVILAELKDKQKENEYWITENVYEDIDIKSIYTGLNEDRAAQYVLTYKHKINNREITIIIATVASFYCNITTMDKNCSDPFSTLVHNYLNNVSIKVDKNSGSFKFAKGTRYLNKQTQIWFDEAQDLELEHIQCIQKLMLSYKIDVGIVGDLLQSLKYEENIFTKLSNIHIPNINIIKPPIENNNRRIKVKGLATEINEYVEFKKYSLPEITVDEEYFPVVDEPFELSILDSGKSVLSNDKDTEKVENYCKNIVDKFRIQIKKNNYIPNDFIIVTPIISGRTELIELKSKLEEMWIEYFNNENYVKNISDEYWKENNHNKLETGVEYVQFHKSESGTAINLKESINKTRIVSTITSKGDGRNVCFVLNVTEKTLKLVSGNKIGLRYESHFHVPITRAIRKVYFELTTNGDNIHKRFAHVNNVYFVPNISKYLNISKIIPFISDAQISKLLSSNNIEYIPIEEDCESKPKFDFTDHCARYAVCKTLLHFCLNYITNNGGHCYQSYKNIFQKISIGPKDTPTIYWKYLNTFSSKQDLVDNLPHIPLIQYDTKYYNGFVSKIQKRMIELQTKLKDNAFNDIQSLDLSLTDYLLISYMLNINRYKIYTPFTINDLYSIVNNIDSNTDIDLTKFYEKITPINYTCTKMINYIENKYGKLQWNIEHSVSFEGNSDDFKIKKPESIIIGNNTEYVVDIMMKTSFSDTEFFNSMIEILLNRFIIYNPLDNTEKSKNKTRFLNKKIITFVYVLETNHYIEYNWDWDKCDDIKNIVKDGIISYYSSYHKELFYYCNKICMNWKDITKDEKDKDNTFNINSPFKFIIHKLLVTNVNLPNYIKHYILNLEQLHNRNKIEVNEIIQNESIFLKTILDDLKNQIDIFFNNCEDIEYNFE